jgi:hypothetical protein
MIWTCPACQIAIQHSEETAHVGVTYRCHVCRLELISGPDNGEMVLAAFRTDNRDSRRETSADAQPASVSDLRGRLNRRAATRGRKPRMPVR